MFSWTPCCNSFCTVKAIFPKLVIYYIPSVIQSFQVGDNKTIRLQFFCVSISVVIISYMHLGDSVSFFSMLRWKSEGPRQTARFIGVIWFSSTKEVTSRRK